MRSKRITLTCSVILLTIVILFPSPSWSQDLEWTFPKEGKIGEIRTSPAIGPDGTIYIGSLDGNLYAVNPDGTSKWEDPFKTGGEIWSSPAVGPDGTIYVGSGEAEPDPEECSGEAEPGPSNAKLHAITPDGGKKWEFQTGPGKCPLPDGVDSSPAIGSDGTIYVGSNDGYVYAIAPESGKEKWKFQTKLWGSEETEDGSIELTYETFGVYSSPAIASDGTVFVGGTDGNLYAIHPEGGKKWFPLSYDAIYSSPAIAADGTVYIGSNDWNLYAINPREWPQTEEDLFFGPDENEEDEYEYEEGDDYEYDYDYPFSLYSTGDAVSSSPVIGPDGTIYVGSWDNHVYVTNPDGSIDIVSRDSYLYAINPDGTPKWEEPFKTGDKIDASPAMDSDEIGNATDPSPAIGSDGVIYIGSLDKNVYAVKPDGTQKWKYETGGEVWSSPVISADGTVYVGSTDGKLYAFASESQGLADSPWPMFHHDARHTGHAGSSDSPSVYNPITPDLQIKAIIHTEDKGLIDAVWKKGGDDITADGHQVIWGYFYASPNDVSWGSEQNPDVFVKIWFDASGRVDVNFFHVSVPNIDVFSIYKETERQGTVTLTKRYIRQWYKDGEEGGMDEQNEDGNPPQNDSPSGSPAGHALINNLRIGAVIHTEDKGMIEAGWRKGGEDLTQRGDQVIWGHFYADPSDVSWGSEQNPDLFVKVWFDVTGWVNVNFFHVSVPNIEGWSALPDEGTFHQKGTTTLENRYVRQDYR